MPVTKKRQEREISAERREELIAKLAELCGGEWFEPSGLTELFETDLAEYYGLPHVTVSWNLSHCQGDGVDLHGSIDADLLRQWPTDGKDCKPEWANRYKELDELLKIAEATTALLGLHYDPQDSIEISQRYGVDGHCFTYRDDECEMDGVFPLDQLHEKCIEWLKSYVDDVCYELKKMGYAEIEYRGSIEYATEAFDSNPEHYDDIL